MEYNEIQIEPVDILFKKICNSRCGEMLLIHINPCSNEEGGEVTVCTSTDEYNSFLIKTLPYLIEKILDEN